MKDEILYVLKGTKILYTNYILPNDHRNLIVPFISIKRIRQKNGTHAGPIIYTAHSV